LREFISYVKDIDGVWFPKREEISDWYAENHASHIKSV
jgi:allantoinase